MFKYIANFFAFLIKYICLAVSYIPVLIYNYIYSRFFTSASYQGMLRHIDFKNNKPPIKKILDVGIGTGHALYSIIDEISPETQILGIDIDRNYIPACQKIFSKHKNVEIKEMNYYNIQKTQDIYDVIIFSSSFMLMPSKEKALEIARSHLSDHGRIFFLMTLYKNSTWYTKLIGYIKPYLKFLTTIDFGQIVYENEFKKMMEDYGLQILQQNKVDKADAKYSKLHKYFRMNVISVGKV